MTFPWLIAFFFPQQIYAQERELEAAGTLMTLGAEYANMQKAEYTRILFLLSKGMVSTLQTPTHAINVDSRVTVIYEVTIQKHLLSAYYCTEP